MAKKSYKSPKWLAEPKANPHVRRSVKPIVDRAIKWTRVISTWGKGFGTQEKVTREGMNFNAPKDQYLHPGTKK